MIPPVTFTASEYTSRDDMDKAVMSRVGADVQANREAGHKIEGKKEDFRPLFLSDRSTVWGVQCVYTDTPTHEQVKNRPRNPRR